MGNPAGRSQCRTGGQPDGNLREKNSALAANGRTLCRQIWREVPYSERGRGRMVCEDKVHFVKRPTRSNPYDEEAEPYTGYDSASLAEGKGFEPL